MRPITVVMIIYLAVVILLLIPGVQAAKPFPDFSANITSGKAPLTVSFTDLSSNNPTGWAWYFGDENFSGQWTQMTPHAAWAGRSGQSVVAMPEGNIVLTGGSKGFPQSFNDAWQSGDNGATWSLVNASPWSLGKIGHSSVVLPDASIVTMSGDSGNGWFSDVWRSVDEGVTWTQLTHDAPWGARIAFPTVAMPDGSIVLMGGFGGSFTYPDDVWKSTDEGSTWTQLTAHAGWSPRAGHTAVVMPDGNIVVMGGNNINSHVVFNDVWRSSDGGKTWTQVNASAGWAPRGSLSSVVMPDGSILLTGGDDLHGHYYNDVWRSTDEGSTWERVNPHAGWSARSSLSAVAMPDGSFIVIAGSGPTVENDVWGLETAGSSAQNPVHTYTKPGTYQVSLQAYNSGGFDSIRKAEYITVLAADNGTLFVNSTPSGAEVYINGVDTGNVTPWTSSQMPPGSYSVMVKLKGYLNGIADGVQVTSDTVTAQDFTLVPYIPEFPSPVIPVVTIIGLLGMILFIRRTKEN